MTATERRHRYLGQLTADLARWDNEGGAPEDTRSKQTPDVGTGTRRFGGGVGVDTSRDVIARERHSAACGGRV